MNQDDFRALLNAPRTSTQATRDIYARHGPVHKPSHRPGVGLGNSHTLFKPRERKSNKSDKPKQDERPAASTSTATPRIHLQRNDGENEHKGLDLEALQRAKEELALQESKEADEALDELLDTIPSTTTPLTTSNDTTEDKAAAKAKKKRSRAEALAALKSSHQAPGADVDAEELKPTKFRKIGSAATTTTAIATGADGKKVKKLRRKKVLPAATHATDATNAIPQATTTPDQTPTPTSQQKGPVPPTAGAKPAPAPVESDDDDIFLGVPDYQSPSSSSDNDSDNEKEAAPTVEQGQTLGKQNWFEDDNDVHADPIAAPSIPRPAPQAAPTSVEEEPQSSRLSGLESSAISDVRALLEADRQAERDEKRRERKEKWKAKQGLPISRDGEAVSTEDAKRIKEKKLTDKDKLNRDYQALNKFLEKKKP